MPDTGRRCSSSPEEVNLPSWVIRRWVVVNDGAVHRFETLLEATQHRQEHGGEVRELEFSLIPLDNTSSSLINSRTRKLSGKALNFPFSI